MEERTVAVVLVHAMPFGDSEKREKVCIWGIFDTMEEAEAAVERADTNEFLPNERDIEDGWVVAMVPNVPVGRLDPVAYLIVR